MDVCVWGQGGGLLRVDTKRQRMAVSSWVSHSGPLHANSCGFEVSN